jgi:predicted ATPase
MLFTDIEGSTRLLQELGREDYVRALTEHRQLLREAFTVRGGVEVDTQGDSFLFAFDSPQDASAAAASAQRALTEHHWESEPIRVRMGVHTGEPVAVDGLYTGLDVHRAARIMSVGHGGQVLISQTTRDFLDEAVEVRDLGEHRLKDLSAPQRLYQLGDGEFPPLKTLNQTNLPVQPTSLIGRERELAGVLELMRSSRLLTLTGAGGSGKTRLALHAAAQLTDEFADGVWFVSLAPIADPDLVLQTVSSTLGVRGDLAEFLRPQRLLLLLDNVEQLLPGAAPSIAGLLAADGVKVLATSRERLVLSGEQEYVVPTLPLGEAVALFTARARQLKPSFEPDEHVEKIAAGLDGLPLALELAASRVKVLTPKQIVERLGQSLVLLTTGSRDAPERQRTLEATIDWSYELLSPEEQQLFARLAVFVGSFDLEAAEAVCDADLDILESLIDKSLLRQTDAGRFFMLETIGEYARERLAQSHDVASLRVEHARFFARLAADAGPHLELGLEQSSWLDRLELEHNNLRAALDYLEREDELEPLIGAVCDLSYFWLLHGHFAEGRRWLEAAIARAETGSRLQFDAYEGAAYLTFIAGNLERSRELADGFLKSAREAGDAVAVGKALHALANITTRSYAFGDAMALEEESLANLQGDPYSRYPRGGLAYIALVMGDLDRADALLRELLAYERDIGAFEGMANSLGLLAIIAAEQGRDADAVDLLRESATISRRLGDAAFLAGAVLHCAALILARRGEAGRAVTALAGASEVLDELGTRRGLITEKLQNRIRATAAGVLDESELNRAEADGRLLQSTGGLDEFVQKTLDLLD